MDPIKPTEYEEVENIATGSHGITVDLIKMKTMGFACLKKIPIPKTNSKAFIKEFKMLYELKHINIVGVLGYTERIGQYHGVLMELMDCNLLDLRTKLNEMGKFTNDKPPVPNDIQYLLFSFYRDVAKGGAFMHSRSVRHTDLALPNILIDCRTMTAKIADLNLARIDERPSLMPSQSSMGIKKRSRWHLIPPEKWIDCECRWTYETDVYQYGISVYETSANEDLMSFGKAKKTQLREDAKSGRIVATFHESIKNKFRNPFIRNQLTKTIQDCCCFNPAERLPFKEIAPKWDNLLDEFSMKQTVEKLKEEAIKWFQDCIHEGPRACGVASSEHVEVPLPPPAPHHLNPGSTLFKSVQPGLRDQTVDAATQPGSSTDAELRPIQIPQTGAHSPLMQPAPGQGPLAPPRQDNKGMLTPVTPNQSVFQHSGAGNIYNFNIHANTVYNYPGAENDPTKKSGRQHHSASQDEIDTKSREPYRKKEKRQSYPTHQDEVEAQRRLENIPNPDGPVARRLLVFLSMCHDIREHWMTVGLKLGMQKYHMKTMRDFKFKAFEEDEWAYAIFRKWTEQTIQANATRKVLAQKLFDCGCYEALKCFT